MMRLPRPASPRALWADIRAFFGQRTRYQWIALGLALAIPSGLTTLVIFDRRDAGVIGPQIIYVESWSANRTLEETVAKQQADQANRNAALEERRRAFQRLEDINNGIGLR